MKHFLMSFLGTMAGIWVSVLLGGLLLILFIVAVAASGTGSETVKTPEPGTILLLNLEGTVNERVSESEPMAMVMEELQGSDSEPLALNQAISALDRASKDKNISGLFIDCHSVNIGLAQAQALITAIDRFKQSGKWVYAYGSEIIQSDYFIASVADSLFLNPIGMIDIHGLESTSLYFKNLLDRLGVDVQVVRVGTYKSAVEPFMLSSMSEANRLQQQAYLGSMWDAMCTTISEARGVNRTEVGKWADSFTFTQDGKTYVEKKIVNRLLYRHSMDSLLAAVTGKDEAQFITVQKYSKTADTNKKSRGRIAVVYAVGDIVERGDGGIVSEDLVPEILDLADDEDVSGLVLRVNSGGGSAFASEQIWEALEQFKSLTGKPYYVSMSDYAASGGYYISCGADRIYAEPLTLTGSIGIFGLIPNVKHLLSDKIGINTETVATNKGGFPTFLEPMSEGQRAAMQSYVDRGYELFVKRCAQGRNMSVDSIKSIAEGRVWDGISALRIGLVDKLGGLEMAVAEMAEELGLGDNYCIEEYPKQDMKWWKELLDMSKNVKNSLIESELGEALPYYKTLKNVEAMSPLQCRMEYVVIK